MTQTNDSELEKWDKAISDEIENQGRDMEIAINNVLNIVHELRDQAFAAGEKSGIAKAENCVPEAEIYDKADHFVGDCDYTLADTKDYWNACRLRMLSNIAKLKNL